MLKKKTITDEVIDIEENDDFEAESRSIADHVEAFFGLMVHLVSIMAWPFLWLLRRTAATAGIIEDAEEIYDETGHHVSVAKPRKRWLPTRNIDTEVQVGEEDAFSPPGENLSPLQESYFRMRALLDEFYLRTGETLTALADRFEAIVGAVVATVARILAPVLTPPQWLLNRQQTNLVPGATDSPTDDDPTTMEKAGVADRLEAPLYQLADRAEDVANIFEGFTSRVARRLPRNLFWPLYLPLDGFLWGYDFMLEWLYTRSPRKLFKAIPAAILLMPVCVLLPLTLRNSKASKIKHYQQALETAREENNQPVIQLLHSKLEQLGHRNLDDVDFREAIRLAKEGQIDEAHEIMQKLAPEEQPGYLSAHLWIAGALMDGQIDAEDPWALLETHTEHALSLDKDNELADRFLIELAMRRGETDKALQLMEKRVGRFPDLHATMAHLYHNRDGAKPVYHARSAIRHYESSITNGSQDDASNKEVGLLEAPKSLSNAKDGLTPVGYLRIAEAYHLDDQFDREIEVLRDGLDTNPDDPELRKIYLSAIAVRLNSLELEDPEILPLLEEALRRVPNHRLAVEKLGKSLFDKSPVAVDYVKQLEAKGIALPRVYELAGNLCMIQQDYPNATAFYTRTCKIDSKSSFAWNNLAWLWGNIEPLNMENALRASNKAVELNPDARFFETRGQLHRSLKNWDQAIKDLERAVSGSVPNVIDAHRGLAEAYEAIGMQEQANAHRALTE